MLFFALLSFSPTHKSVVVKPLLVERRVICVADPCVSCVCECVIHMHEDKRPHPGREGSFVLLHYYPFKIGLLWQVAGENKVCTSGRGVQVSAAVGAL